MTAASCYVSASRAASTREKYERAWNAFQLWCDAEALPALLARLGTVAVPPRRKAAADGALLAQVLAALPGEDLRAKRDRAVLVFGMACCLRRSELVVLDVSDRERVPEGLRVTIRHSKTDQEGRGAVVAVPKGRSLRPVAALETWLRTAGVTEGPVFRRLSHDGTRATGEPMSDRAVARVVQARAAVAGLDPAAFGGHSLRAGFITAAAAAGAGAFRMREVSRHKSIQVLADYV